MSSQITLTVSLIMIALFSLAIIGFSIGFANDNNAAISIADDSQLSELNINIRSGLQQFKEDSEGTYQSILETTVEPGSDVVPSSAPFAITPGNLITTTKNIVRVGYDKIFGAGSSFGFFLTTFLVFLVLIFGLLVIKTWRGNP